jgi:hypothetical protein
MTDMVSNPMYTALSQLYTQLQQDAPTMSNALKPADQQMAGGQGQVWVGPAARSWGSDLSGYSSDCGTQVTSMLDAVQQAMQAQPQHVTETEAAGIAKQMGLIASGR